MPHTLFGSGGTSLGGSSLTKINTGLAQKAQLYLNPNAARAATVRSILY
jgi:hypothetical protein